MLKRIYIDNYRCLVNFDLALDRISLLLGLNGSGKSTVFEVLNSLQKFIGGQARVDDVFSSKTLNRWDQRLTQNFELEVSGATGTYVYQLAIEHDKARQKARVQKEILLLDGRPLFAFQGGEVQLYRDNYSEGPNYPFDWGQSGLGTILERPDNTHLTWFKAHMRQFILVSLKPDQMKPETWTENSHLLPGAENFASWYRYLLQEHQKCMFDLVEKLSEVLPKFREFRLAQSGDQRILETVFSTDQGEKLIYYRFNELSDGQRALIVLYALLFAASGSGQNLFLDEPENYIALPELQPWLMELIDECEESTMQVIIISHHPEFIDYLGPEHRIWLERADGGPTRIGTVIVPPDSTLSLSEQIARGWEHNG
jgi:predicted ATPase